MHDVLSRPNPTRACGSRMLPCLVVYSAPSMSLPGALPNRNVTSSKGKVELVEFSDLSARISCPMVSRMSIVPAITWPPY